MFKVNNRNTRARSEICSKLTIKTPARHHWRRSGVFIVNFEHISHLAVVFLLLTLNIWMPIGKGSVVWKGLRLSNSRVVFESQRSPPNVYLFKVSIRNTRKRCEICSKLTINTPKQHHWRSSGVFIVNFEHIWPLILVFLF